MKKKKKLYYNEEGKLCKASYAGVAPIKMVIKKDIRKTKQVLYQKIIATIYETTITFAETTGNILFDESSEPAIEC